MSCSFESLPILEQHWFDFLPDINAYIQSKKSSTHNPSHSKHSLLSQQTQQKMAAIPFPCLKPTKEAEPKAIRPDLNVRLICDDPSRVGAAANPLLDGAQLDTVISRKDGGSGTARDLNKVHGRATAVKGEKNLIQAYKEIAAMCDAIGLTKLIADIAKQLYKRAEEEKLLRGKSTESIIAACIFIACRQENVPRTFKEICAITRVPKKEIGRCFKTLIRTFETNVATMTSEDLMSRFCSMLGLSIQVQKAAVDLTKKVKDCGTLAGKSPVSVAAACIYLVSNLYSQPKTTREIAHVTGVSEVTIKNSYKLLYQDKGKLLEDKKGGNCEALPSP
ncbi:1091_t:CDS:2 [Ambispora gerdemannii]|uniref:Transcription initiation factor IIB n=1 Tax=Ambispora gerdemannii TaxID=144530 RepID=A0A9N9CCR7_9GLOM|nr:1091_t:CDS:2 [Ambispora gerdemannii]